MKNKDYIIRQETKADYQAVEKLTREAFWNQHVPGCNEHYLVHVMRNHKDFVPELDYVVELGKEIVANVMYTRSKLIDEKGNEKVILSFGPLSVLPEYQRQGFGRALLEFTFDKAVDLGYDVVAIFGHPSNYVSRGLISCKKHNVCLEGDIYPTALLVKELKKGVLDGRKWYFHAGDVEEALEDEEAVNQFDALFPHKEKEWRLSQEEFYIYSHSTITR